MFKPKYKDITPVGYYVYVHRRLSDMSVFYVGKGVLNRAWNKTSGRSQHWKNIANKHGVYVEILIDGLSEDEAFAFEIDMIKKTKGLINYASGGQGKSGVPSTSKQKESARIARSKAVINSKGDIYESATVATKELLKIGIKANRATISLACAKRINAYGMSWSFYKDGDNPPDFVDTRSKCIKNYGIKVKCSNGMVFDSISLAVDWLKNNGKPKAAASPISKAIRGKLGRVYGFYWEIYVDDQE